MCGIVGIVGQQDSQWVLEMNRLQAHRGPDDQGVFREGEVALAMRRLSIVDLHEGHQPMIDAERGRVVVFNGEIFNAPALRRQLEGDGYRFQTRNSDTEVLLYLYDKYEDAMVGHLNGMFAFVILDRRGRRLFGARDRVGIKPLYYALRNRTFAFASELKSLLAMPGMSDGIDRQSLHHYLTFQFVPPPRSIYAQVSKLPAGHCFHFDLDHHRLEISRYWHPPHPQADADRTDVAPALRAHLEQAVDDWLLSDVPVGCSLSGGIDSSAVVGLMAARGAKPVKTWTLGFEEDHAQALDERQLARRVAQRWGCEHHEVLIKANDVLRDLDKMVWHLDEPYAGGLPSWYIFREMSRHVKVAMTGTGGDELFGNYGKWRIYRPPTLGILKTALLRAWGQGAISLRHPRGALYHGYFGEREKRKIWNADAAGMEASPALIERLWRASGCKDARDAVPAIDMQLQLPEEFLLMTDRFSMAWSLEARTPLLDHRLIEFVLGLPPARRTQPGNLKRIFKDAVKDLLPPELLGAAKKGFVLPVDEWLRTDLRERVEYLLGRHYLQQQGLFDPRLYARYVVPHMRRARDFSWQVWTLFMFQLWWHGSRQAPAAADVALRANSLGA